MLLTAAREAFVAGMSSAAGIGAVIVAVGAVVVLVWLPGRTVPAPAEAVPQPPADAAPRLATS
jgi:hypothetical protein